MTNLLEETEYILNKNNKELSDILWVGGDDFEIDLQNFLDIAAETNYDAGFGAQKVATDLMIIGKDFWMKRCEYDGSEWWEFYTMPEPPSHNVEYITSLKVRTNQIGWRTLSYINRGC